jgi:uncharacterized membrane protein (DUF106 family)
MEELLDILWFKILDIIHYVAAFLDVIFTPLNFLGPAITISTIAFITAGITRFLTKIFKTKRHIDLKKEFEHWYNLRQKALKCGDPDKAELLAKNIDHAKLNEVYYNYFLEGFFNSLATKCLPITIFLTYVNEAYKAENLLKLFGREYIFKLRNFNGNEIVIGSALWFIVSLILIYPGWFIVKKFVTIRHKDMK